MSTNINHYGILAVVTIIGFTIGYRLYKEFDDLRKRREKQDVDSVLNGIMLIYGDSIK